MSGIHEQHTHLLRFLWMMAVFCLGLLAGYSQIPDTEEAWEAYLQKRQPVVVCRFVGSWSEPELHHQIVSLLGWTVPKNSALVVTCVEEEK